MRNIYKKRKVAISNLKENLDVELESQPESQSEDGEFIDYEIQKDVKSVNEDSDIDSDIDSEYNNDMDNEYLGYLEKQDLTENLNSLSHEKKTEYKLLKTELDAELPSLEKILNSQITKNDKKECLKLFTQFANLKNSSDINSEYYRLIDCINLLLKKSDNYTLEEIKFLESEENRLNSF